MRGEEEGSESASEATVEDDDFPQSYSDSNLIYYDINIFYYLKMMKIYFLFLHSVVVGSDNAAV